MLCWRPPAAAARGAAEDREPALELSFARLRVRHIETAARLVSGEHLTALHKSIDEHFDSLDELLRGIAAVGELTARTSDLIVSFGERLSSLIIAAAFVEKGTAAAHVDARTIIRTDGHHGKAVPQERAIEHTLLTHVLPIIEEGIVPGHGRLHRRD